MAAALIAHASSRLICKDGVYHALAKGFVERATSSDVKQPSHRMLLEEMA
jgi:chloride channel protein, CIC family